MQRQHPHSMKELDKLITEHREGKRPRDDDADSNKENPPKKQTTLDFASNKRNIVTQPMLDKAILEFVIKEIPPLAMVDKPTFINLVRLGLPQELSVMCARTAKTKL